MRKSGKTAELVDGEKLGWGRSFLKLGCAFEGIWKTGSLWEKGASVSHDSHRQPEKACAKGMVYVKSASGAALGKELKETGDAQSTEFSID